jgi:M penetrans paralogue family 26
MEEKSIFDQPNQPFQNQQPLPNATAVLVMGILSIVICGIGVVLGIIALVLAKKDTELYNAGMEIYAPSSYSNLKAGKICGVIGIILSSLFILVYGAIIIFAISTAGSIR